MAEKHEKRFLEALRDIFVGAEIEGEGGFINLMRIKSRYYTEGVGPRLLDLINDELKPFPEFREELFDKLYTFFKRYFSESGSIYFRHTPYHQDVYEKIYTDDRDVMLFWKTQNLYYVKTDRLFRTMTITLEDSEKPRFLFDASGVEKQSFNFDASNLENKRNNEKRSLIFEYKGKGDKSDTLAFRVLYSEGGKKTKVDDILKEVKKDGFKVTEDQLTRAFRLFERQTEVDFFINKNARAFLTEQFDLWMYQYIFKHETEFREKRIRQLQVLKKVAYAIIDFISQFEDELVRIWNKPKFVRASGYIITFDKILERDKEIAKELTKAEGFKAQVKEWQELGLIDRKFSSKQLFTEQRFQYLPFDTKYFKQIEPSLIALFENIDEQLDGRLVYSENYQALKTLGRKFDDKAKFIYIDPPYNAVVTEIAYVNEYRHASWLSMIADRIMLSLELLPPDGILCATIDDYEFQRLCFVVDEIFGEDNRLGTVCIRNNPSGRATVRGFAVNHEYGLFYGKSDLAKLGRLPHTEEQKDRYAFEDSRGNFEWENFRKNSAGSFRIDRPKQFFPIFLDRTTKRLRVPEMEWIDSKRCWKLNESPSTTESELLPVDEHGRERVWRFGVERTIREISDLEAKDRDGRTEVYKRKYLQTAGILPRTWWDKADYSARDNGTRALVDLFGAQKDFDFPKAVAAVQDSIRVGNVGDDDLVLDFFSGSGTTAHAVIALNREEETDRRYLLVESNDYFYTVILPRVKKVVFSDNWRNGKALVGKGTSHFCKYFALEQYEDTLRRAVFIDDKTTTGITMFDDPYETPFSTYVFLRDPKMSNSLAIDYDAKKVRVDFSKLYDDIDWAETLSCIKGKFIKSQTSNSVTFTDGETINFDDIDYHDILPLIWWDK